MKRNELYAFVTLSMAMLVPVQGRLAYGIILVILLNLLTALGLPFKKLTAIFFDNDMQSAVTATFLIALCTIFKQLLTLFSPLIAMTLGLSLYMPSLTPFMLGSLCAKSGNSLGEDMAFCLKRSAIFSVAALVFFAFRDILGYGTITLPSRSGISETILFNPVAGSFLATIPGAIVLLAVSFAATSLALKKKEIAQLSNGAKNAE